MKITFYMSNLCPRCRQADKHLSNALKDFPNINVLRVDILRSPLQTLKNKIYLIPALQSEQETLCGFTLSEEKIHTFLASLKK